MPRPPGIPNRNRGYTLNKLKEMWGDDFDPLVKMAESCNELIKLASDYKKEHPTNWTEIFSFNERIVSSFDKVASYTQPKLKAIEVKTDSLDPFEGLSRDDLLLRYQLLEKIAAGNISGDSENKGGASEEREISG